MAVQMVAQMADQKADLKAGQMDVVKAVLWAHPSVGSSAVEKEIV